MSEHVFPVKVAMVTNIPSPYREEMHVVLSNKLRSNYHVYYCAHIEPNRLWKFEYGNYKRTFLKRSGFTLKSRRIYSNLDIIKELNKFEPDVVITAGFFPTAIMTFIWCKLKGRKHICFTDATLQSEEGLSFFHKIIRKTIFSFTEAFIAVSKKGCDLYLSYQIDIKKIFWSPICIQNCRFQQFFGSKKKYDILWSGQFIERKLPFFFVEVLKLVNTKIPCKVILIGSGPLKAFVTKSLTEANIDYTFPGFLQQNELPIVYASSRLLLFPTSEDPWGVVANEACAAGVPVITCENAGAANELIIHGHNGYVLPLDPKIWAEHIIDLLNDEILYDKFAKNALNAVQKYNYENAAIGILNAIQYVNRK